MKIFKIVITVFAFSTFFSCNKKVENKTEATNEEQIENTTKFEPTWESLKKAKPAEWWAKGKFGIFIHWGPYSVAGYKDKNKGYAEAITNHMYKKPEAYANFMTKKFGATMPDWL
jgi:alpha-L-fucosidase